MLGVDPDGLTQSEYDDCMALLLPLLKWEKGEDFRSEVSARKTEWEGLLRKTFGGAAVEQENEDELGAG